MRLFDLFLIVITISRLFYKKIENMSQSKSISGFYENLPQEQIREDKYKDTIKHVYSLSGFTSIETPAIERVETLLSK
jgi:histidyl-tRNA synthetase